MVNKLVDVTKAFGFSYLYWGVVIIISVIFDKEAYTKAGRARWKAILLSVVFISLAILCFVE